MVSQITTPGNNQYDSGFIFWWKIMLIPIILLGPFYILIATVIVFMAVLGEWLLTSGNCHSKLDSEGILKLQSAFE